MPEQITTLQALILGVVEGITEFLPISSTGHLLVCSSAIGAANTSGTFEIVIQLGAIIAVVIYYWKRLMAKLLTLREEGGLDWKNENSALHFWVSLFLAFLPAAVVGLALHDWIDALLEDRSVQAYVIAATLFVGGIILWAVDRDGNNKDTADGKAEEKSSEVQTDAAPAGKDACNVTYRQALWIGVAQCFSLIPGVSRSGSTIVGGLLTGLNRSQATDFSFFLSIPTLGAATVYTLIKSYAKLMAVGNMSSLTLGTVVSFITAFLSIGWLLHYVSSNSFKGFAVYRMIAGVVIAAWAFMCC